MKVTFLGTGTSQGIPVIGCKCPTCLSTNKKDTRLRCAVHVAVNEIQFVIDIGPDFRYQLLSNGIDHIDFALITHEHSDHTAGLDDVRPINFQSKKHLDIYGLPRVMEHLIARFGYIFNVNPYPGSPRITPNKITEKETLSIKGVDIFPIKVLHGNLPILGYRIGKFAYLTDVKTIPEEEFSKLKNLDTLVLSCLRHEEHYTHLTFEESKSLIDRINPQKAYLIHMSHTLGPVDQWSKDLPPYIQPAFDGLVINI